MKKETPRQRVVRITKTMCALLKKCNEEEKKALNDLGDDWEWNGMQLEIIKMNTTPEEFSRLTTLTPIGEPVRMDNGFKNPHKI